jgi:hypothetical protein
MNAEVQTRSPAATFACAAERHISERTWRRVHRLACEVDGDRVVVRGCAPSYYVKQLAIQAVREVVEGTAAAPVVLLDIAVSPAPPRPGPTPGGP